LFFLFARGNPQAYGFLPAEIRSVGDLLESIELEKVAAFPSTQLFLLRKLIVSL